MQLDIMGLKAEMILQLMGIIGGIQEIQNTQKKLNGNQIVLENYKVLKPVF